jgi:hypothetical protein
MGLVRGTPGGGDPRRRRTSETRQSPATQSSILKDRVLEIDDFLEAVRRVGRGGTAIDPPVIGQLLGRAREEGICGRLFLSPKTIETHVNRIFLKLGLMPAPDDHRRFLAVLAFLRS